MSRAGRAWVLVFTLLGLMATSASTRVHYKALASPVAVSVCDVNQTFNCSDVYRSEYGSVAGVPVALLGVCFFTGLLLLQIGSHFAGWPALANLASHVFVLSIPALAFAAYLAWASAFVLQTFCLLCLAIDVAVVGLFVTAGREVRFTMTNWLDKMTSDLRALRARPFVLAGLLVFAVAVAGVLASFSSLGSAPVVAAPAATAPAPSAPEPAAPPPSHPSPQAARPSADNVMAEVQRILDTQPRRMIPVDAQGAKVVVVKFNDYECPPCKQTFNMYKPVKSKWEQQAPGQVKFVSKDFPLEPECNKAVPRGIHQFACEAAAAVRLARTKGKADAMEDWLFANQGKLSAESIKQAVRDIGGVPDFDAQYAHVLNDVRVDTSLGGFLGVNSTPTFFINGVRIDPWLPEVLDAAIAYELQKSSK